MLKRSLRFVWGKKLLLITVALVVLLLPHVITRNLQVHTTTVVTQMTISRDADNFTVTAQILNADPQTFTGPDLRTLLQAVDLGHCRAINFLGTPDTAALKDLYNYQNLRGSTVINGQTTLDQLLQKS